MKECCSSEKCCCPCHEEKECHGDRPEMMGEYFLSLADEAWEELLKEKIKEHILSTQNKRMTDLAKIVSEGNNARWRSKMQSKQGCAEFTEKLCSFMSQSKK